VLTCSHCHRNPHGEVAAQCPACLAEHQADDSTDPGDRRFLYEYAAWLAYDQARRARGNP
jgi:hypothetical protein